VPTINLAGAADGVGPPSWPDPDGPCFTAGYERRVLDRVGHFLPHEAPGALVQAIGDLAVKARDGKLVPDDFAGGTFTITNGGVFGSLMSTPILNLPQVGILGMHSIQRRPVAVGDNVEIRPMMYLAVSYDHRIIDGREAVSFLVRVKELVEHPERILLEV
jgi:2-oxoglutarate dehydrogenase E2 component (dihydrolipoamide succinyltransferase)